MTKVDGIYVAYFTGAYGTSLGMFLIKDGVVSGADVGGGVYDGTLCLSEDEKTLSGTIHFRTNSTGITITGAQLDLPVAYDTDVILTNPLNSIPFQQISTLSGLVNVRFEKVREL